MFYWNHRIKCLDCGLHYVVCSDYEGWPDEGTTREIQMEESTGVIYCPECGSSTGKLVYEPTKEAGYIAQMVPGPAIQVRRVPVLGI